MRERSVSTTSSRSGATRASRFGCRTTGGVVALSDLPAHSIRAEDVQLAVARQVEASIGGYRATARAYRPVDARSCIYDERDARRHGGEDHRGEEGPVNAGSDACR